MKTHMEHVIDLPADQYFDRIYFNEDFNEALYKELKFRERSILVERDDGDTIYREVRQVPERDLPGPVKKVLGASEFAYVEKSTYHKANKSIDLVVVSSVKPDKVKTTGRFWIEPLDDNRCKRLLDFEVKVSIFGLGGVVEQLVMQDLESSYDRSAAFTNRYIRENL